MDENNIPVNKNSSDKLPEVEEITILNLDALDIAELEERLEMAGLLPNSDCWVHDNCGCHGVFAVPAA